MRNRHWLAVIVILAGLGSGCATTRDTQDVVIQRAELAPLDKDYQQKFSPTVTAGQGTVVIHRQNARCYGADHTREQYANFALELPNKFELLKKIDINDPAVKFRYTEGLFNGPWQFNQKQEGFVYVHRETATTLELCLEVKLWLQWAETYSPAGAGADEAAKEVQLRRFFVFQKNRFEAYVYSNEIPSFAVSNVEY